MARAVRPGSVISHKPSPHKMHGLRRAAPLKKNLNAAPGILDDRPALHLAMHLLYCPDSSTEDKALPTRGRSGGAPHAAAKPPILI